MRDWLAARAARAPETLALIDADTGTRVTYRELDRAVDRLAAGLRSVEVGPCTRVGTICPRGPEAITLVWATLRTGATLAPLDDSAPPETLRELAEVAEIDHLVVDETDRDGPGVPTPQDVKSHSREALTEAGAAAEDPRSDSGIARSGTIDETRVLLFTSGTTGEPKAVQLTPRNLGASAAGSAFRLGVEPGDRWLLTLPLYHMGGLAIPLRSAMYGTAVIVEGAFEAGRTTEHIEEFEATGISLVPTMLKRLLDADWRPALLRFALVGGAPTPESLARQALEAGVPLYTTYGMTETASQVATATPGELRTDPATVGRPLRTVTVGILDEDGSPRPPGERGQVAVTGPVVSPGYLDTSWEKNDHSWFLTGDEGYLDGEGKLYVKP